MIPKISGCYLKVGDGKRFIYSLVEIYGKYWTPGGIITRLIEDVRLRPVFTTISGEKEHTDRDVRNVYARRRGLAFGKRPWARGYGDEKLWEVERWKNIRSSKWSQNNY